MENMDSTVTNVLKETEISLEDLAAAAEESQQWHPTKCTMDGRSRVQSICVNWLKTHKLKHSIKICS